MPQPSDPMLTKEVGQSARHLWLWDSTAFQVKGIRIGSPKGAHLDFLGDLM